MIVKFKKENPEAVIPSYAKPGDNGLDLTAISYSTTDEYHEYRFGLSVEIPSGYVGIIAPRSSISRKDLILCNSVGVIDSSYRGEFTARFKQINNKYNPKVYYVGDRVAQLLIVPCPEITPVEVDNLSETSRGDGGYGSSGA